NPGEAQPLPREQTGACGAMIQFRCWYCNKRYAVPEQRVGERITCTCSYLLRVPKRSGGICRIKTLTDWIIETVLYGGGGALLGFGLAVLILSQLRLMRLGWMLILVCTAAGFLLGSLGGERGIEWIGRIIRDRENS